MTKIISKIVFLAFIATASSCASNDDEVYVDTILGYWDRTDIKVLVETTNPEASLLLKEFYLVESDERHTDEILFFGENSLFKSYRNVEDEDPRVTIYTMTEKRIAIGGIQGLCYLTLVGNTMDLLYDHTPYITAEDFKKNLAAAGYTGTEDVQLLKKIYKWRFVRMENPFPAREESSKHEGKVA